MGLIIGGSLAFSIGGAFMKASNGFTRTGPTLVVIASFLLGAALLARQVARSDLSSTFVVGSGVEALLTLGFAVAVLGERPSLPRVVGVVLVVAGVVCVRAA